MQEKDLTCDGAMTDPKGDRSLASHKQAAPDLFLRILEERKDGIVVRGAKAHQTSAVNSYETSAMPTIALGKEDQDYAVSSAVPSNASGVLIIMGRQSCDTRKLEAEDMDTGNVLFGGHEALIAFDDVFVPYERVFMFRGHVFAGQLVPCNV